MVFKKWFGGSKEPKDSSAASPFRGSSRKQQPPTSTTGTPTETYQFKSYALPTVSMAERDNFPPSKDDTGRSKEPDNENYGISTANRKTGDPWMKEKKKQETVNIYGQGYNAMLAAHPQSSGHNTSTSLTSSASANFDNSKFRKVNDFGSPGAKSGFSENSPSSIPSTSDAYNRLPSPSPAESGLNSSQTMPVFSNSPSSSYHAHLDSSQTSGLDDLDEDFMDSILASD